MSLNISINVFLECICMYTLHYTYIVTITQQVVSEQMHFHFFNSSALNILEPNNRALIFIIYCVIKVYITKIEWETCSIVNGT